MKYRHNKNSKEEKECVRERRKPSMVTELMQKNTQKHRNQRKKLQNR